MAGPTVKEILVKWGIDVSSWKNAVQQLGKLLDDQNQKSAQANREAIKAFGAQEDSAESLLNISKKQTQELQTQTTSITALAKQYELIVDTNWDQVAIEKAITAEIQKQIQLRKTSGDETVRAGKLTGGGVTTKATKVVFDQQGVIANSIKAVIVDLQTEVTKFLTLEKLVTKELQKQQSVIDAIRKSPAMKPAGPAAAKGLLGAGAAKAAAPASVYEKAISQYNAQKAQGLLSTKQEIQWREYILSLLKQEIQAKVQSGAQTTKEVNELNKLSRLAKQFGGGGKPPGKPPGGGGEGGGGGIFDNFFSFLGFGTEGEKAGKGGFVEGLFGGFASKMAGTIGFAILSAEGLGRVLEKLYEQLKDLVLESDKFANVWKTFENLSGRAGTAPEAFIDQLKESTRGLVGDMTLAGQANRLLMQGISISTDQVNKLTGAVSDLARVQGIDATTAQEEMTRALASGRLQSLAYSLGLEHAVREQLNLTSSLPESIRLTTEYAIVLEAAQKQLAKTGPPIETVGTAVTRANKAFSDFIEKVALKAVDTEGAKNLEKIFDDLAKALDDKDTIAGFASVIGKVMDVMADWFHLLESGWELVKGFVGIIGALGDALGTVGSAGIEVAHTLGLVNDQVSEKMQSKMSGYASGFATIGTFIKNIGHALGEVTGAINQVTKVFKLLKDQLVDLIHLDFKKFFTDQLDFWADLKTSVVDYFSAWYDGWFKTSKLPPPEWWTQNRPKSMEPPGREKASALAGQDVLATETTDEALLHEKEKELENFQYKLKLRKEEAEVTKALAEGKFQDIKAALEKEKALYEELYKAGSLSLQKSVEENKRIRIEETNAEIKNLEQQKASQLSLLAFEQKSNQVNLYRAQLARKTAAQGKTPEQLSGDASYKIAVKDVKDQEQIARDEGIARSKTAIEFDNKIRAARNKLNLDLLKEDFKLGEDSIAAYKTTIAALEKLDKERLANRKSLLEADFKEGEVSADAYLEGRIKLANDEYDIEVKAAKDAHDLVGQSAASDAQLQAKTLEAASVREKEFTQLLIDEWGIRTKAAEDAYDRVKKLFDSQLSIAQSVQKVDPFAGRGEQVGALKSLIELESSRLQYEEKTLANMHTINEDWFTQYGRVMATKEQLIKYNEELVKAKDYSSDLANQAKGIASVASLFPKGAKTAEGLNKFAQMTEQFSKMNQENQLRMQSQRDRKSGIVKAPPVTPGQIFEALKQVADTTGQDMDRVRKAYLDSAAEVLKWQGGLSQSEEATKTFTSSLLTAAEAAKIFADKLETPSKEKAPEGKTISEAAPAPIRETPARAPVVAKEKAPAIITASAPQTPAPTTVVSSIQTATTTAKSATSTLIDKTISLINSIVAHHPIVYAADKLKQAMPAFEEGGPVKETGPAFVHKDEYVLTVQEAAAYRRLKTALSLNPKSPILIEKVKEFEKEHFTKHEPKKPSGIEILAKLSRPQFWTPPFPEKKEEAGPEWLHTEDVKKWMQGTIKGMPSFQFGGSVTQTGPAFLHKGETVLTADITKFANDLRTTITTFQSGMNGLIQPIRELGTVISGVISKATGTSTGVPKPEALTPSSLLTQPIKASPLGPSGLPTPISPSGTNTASDDSLLEATMRSPQPTPSLSDSSQMFSQLGGIFGELAAAVPPVTSGFDKLKGEFDNTLGGNGLFGSLKQMFGGGDSGDGTSASDKFGNFLGGAQQVAGGVGGMMQAAKGTGGPFQAGMAGMSAGMQLGSMIPLPGAPIIGAGVGLITGIFSGKAEQAAEKLAKKIVAQFNAALQNLNSGTQTLSATIQLEIQNIQQAVTQLSGKKGGRDQLKNILPNMESQLAQLQQQQQQIIKTFDEQLNTLNAPQAYQEQLTSIDAIIQKYQQYIQAGGNVANANEYLRQSYANLVQNGLNTLNQDEQDAINNALQYNDLLLQRQNLIQDTNQQIQDIMSQGVAVRQMPEGVTKARQIQQLMLNNTEQMDQLNQQISVSKYKLDTEQQIYNLATTRIGLESQLTVLMNEQTDLQTKQVVALGNVVGGLQNQLPTSNQAALQEFGLGAAYVSPTTEPGLVPVPPVKTGISDIDLQNQLEYQQALAAYQLQANYPVGYISPTGPIPTTSPIPSTIGTATNTGPQSPTYLSGTGLYGTAASGASSALTLAQNAANAVQQLNQQWNTTLTTATTGLLGPSALPGAPPIPNLTVNGQQVDTVSTSAGNALLVSMGGVETSTRVATGPGTSQQVGIVGTAQQVGTATTTLLNSLAGIPVPAQGTTNPVPSPLSSTYTYTPPASAAPTSPIRFPVETSQAAPPIIPISSTGILSVAPVSWPRNTLGTLPTMTPGGGITPEVPAPTASSPIVTLLKSVTGVVNGFTTLIKGTSTKTAVQTSIDIGQQASKTQGTLLDNHVTAALQRVTAEGQISQLSNLRVSSETMLVNLKMQEIQADMQRVQAHNDLLTRTQSVNGGAGTTMEDMLQQTYETRGRQGFGRFYGETSNPA